MSNIIFYQYVQLEEFIFSAKKQLPVFVPLTEIKQCETTLFFHCHVFEQKKDKRQNLEETDDVWSSRTINPA